MDFEWNKNKAEINLKKHGVSFQEAAAVFGDKLALTFNVPDHSVDELRLPTFGATELINMLWCLILDWILRYESSVRV